MELSQRRWEAACYSHTEKKGVVGYKTLHKAFRNAAEQLWGSQVEGK